MRSRCRIDSPVGLALATFVVVEPDRSPDLRPRLKTLVGSTDPLFALTAPRVHSPIQSSSTAIFSASSFLKVR